MQVTLRNSGRALSVSAVLARGKSPGHGGQSQNLPAEVGRQDQEPCDGLSISDPADHCAEEIAETLSAILAKYRAADEVDGDRQQNQADKNQPEEQRELAK